MYGHVPYVSKDFFVHGCIHTVRVCSCLGGGCACAEALKWIHAGVHSAWQEESLLAKNHGYAAHIQYTWTHSWRQSETEERQYSMRQASGLQSTIPASSYLVGGIPGTRPNQTRQVWSVKGHGAFDSAHVLSSLWFGFFSAPVWNIMAISADIKSLFHHLRQKCNSEWSTCNL